MIMMRRPDGPRSGEGHRFRPGALVVHKRYGYRGVVVDFDPVCKADQAWYESNQTQPKRDQAWYHVFVHGAAHTTYAAEDSLLPDTSAEPIAHPLLHHFFSAWTGGGYVRNERPWPSG